MRPVKGASQPRTRAATAKYEAVWVTCDDLAAEGILVSCSAASASSLPHQAVCRVLHYAHYGPEYHLVCTVPLTATMV